MSTYNSQYLITVLMSVVIILQTGCARPAQDTPAATGRENPSAEAVRLTPANVDASEPYAATDAEGNIFVVYAEHLDGRTADIKLLKLDARGKNISEAVRVNTDPGDAKVWAGDPPRVVVRGQNVYIGWTKMPRDQAASGTDLVLSVSRDSGSTFEPPVRVNDDVEPASHGMHSLAVGEDGDVIMLWLDERSLVGRSAPMAGSHEMAEPNAEAYYAISKDGGKSFGRNVKLAADVCPCCKTSLMIDRDGAIYASWRQVLEGDHRHIAVARSDDGADTFNKHVIVSDDKWQISACPVSGSALLSPQPGILDVLWYTAGDAGQPGLYFARSTDKGNSFGPRILFSNEARAGTPSASVEGDRETVVFPATDGRVNVVSWNDSPVSQTNRSTVPDAILPSVIALDGGSRIVFVRTIDSKRSVWTQ